MTQGVYLEVYPHEPTTNLQKLHNLETLINFKSFQLKDR